MFQQFKTQMLEFVLALCSPLSRDMLEKCIQMSSVLQNTVYYKRD
jgi:hypothetical protein